MSMPRSPSVPTMRGSSVSSAPMRSAADGSLIAGPSCSRPAYPSPRERLLVAARAYGVAVAVAERDVASPRRVLPWTGVVAPWLLSRVVSVVVLLAAVNDPARGSRFEQVATRWDGAFYLDIARNGYGPVDIPFPKWPFFPLLPGLIRFLSELADDKAAIFVLNQLLFLLALAGVSRLASRRGGPRVAALSVWSLALFPASFVFSMTYPSAIFLAASVWAFLLVEAHHDLAAGLLAAAATIVRPNGILVAVALVFAARTARRVMLVAAPAVVVLAAWCWYCYDRTGDAFVFLTTKARWEEISAIGVFDGHAKLSVLPHGVLALAAIAVVLLQRRKLPGAWILLTALSLLPSLVTGMVGLARYTNECFPPFVAAGQIL